MANYHHHKPRTTTRKSSSSSSSSSSSTVCCDGSRSAAIDVFILLAVVTSSAFLIFPYIRFIAIKSLSIFSDLSCLLKQEIFRDPDPIVYGLIAWSVLCTALSGLMIVLILCSRRRRCGKPNCRGLGRANAEFDIQIESEDCSVKRLKSGVISKKGLFELARDRNRELEAELQKMAPENGRAVLVFRAKCGCCVGRLVVPGPRKIKK
ncbi:hypothetical protein HID58_050689 [Brassica napus]|uniref:(rape) hypothetical protein n=1 Tax=Brassica napus TaxID=3708 RepID=A0A816I0C8_BRANA|nr:uncharacterized protein At5g19025 [Brassica napus]KAH0888260.1 hypothetical protein HID58_050689 [Brassica napus]CAF1697500.1 unnamed protein product [Brassica napus]